MSSHHIFWEIIIFCEDDADDDRVTWGELYFHLFITKWHYETNVHVDDDFWNSFRNDLREDEKRRILEKVIRREGSSKRKHVIATSDDVVWLCTDEGITYRHLVDGILQALRHPHCCSSFFRNQWNSRQMNVGVWDVRTEQR